MYLNLKNKVALVSASSKGLGYGIAMALAKEGAFISIGSRDKNNLKKAQENIKSTTGTKVLATELDCLNAESISKWIDNTYTQFGGVDKLVVNAGGPPAGKFEDFYDEDWQTAFEMNLLSAVRMIRGTLPLMRKRGGGSILTITSMSVKEPIDVLILSNVLRSGVTSLIKSLSIQFAEYNIRLNNLMPGKIDTERIRNLDSKRSEIESSSIEKIKEKSLNQIPLSRYGTIEEFGNCGAFLLSDAASYITGSSLAVDGGALKTVW